MTSKQGPNRVYLINGEDTDKAGMREAQIELFGRPNRV